MPHSLIITPYNHIFLAFHHHFPFI